MILVFVGFFLGGGHFRPLLYKVLYKGVFSLNSNQPQKREVKIQGSMSKSAIVCLKLICYSLSEQHIFYSVVGSLFEIL